MATTTAQIKIRRDTAANWISSNPTLASGECGLDTTSGIVKVGDGSTAWTSLTGYSKRRSVQLSTVNPTDSSAVATGEVRGGEFVADFPGVITGWRIIGRPTTGQTVGSCTLDIWKKSATGGWPTNSDTITASAKPSLSSAIEGSSSTLTAWTTSVAIGDKFVLEVESVTNLSAITIVLTIEPK